MSPPLTTPQYHPTALATTPSLELQHITRSYGRKRVLDGITHRFTPGLTLLLGPSGAGKSTLLRLLATAEKPTSGCILWNGQLLPGAHHALRQTLGYAPQAVDLPEDLTAREFAQHIAALKGLDLAAADQQFLTLTQAVGLHADIHFKISTFSGGMRRRLIFAQSLLGSPKLIALDEPTAELDLDAARRVGQLALQHAQTAIVVMTTHLSDELASNADAILRVEQGKLAQV
jgi:ABC-2 type transport system ATP-binding protein